MTHIREHCNQPKAKRKDEGRLWACTCGKVWVVRYGVTNGLVSYETPLAFWDLLFTAKVDQ